MIKFLDLQKVTESHGAEIREAVDRVISSGWYLQGQENARFEADYARYIGTRHAVGVANGLDALIWIFRAYMELGVMRPGDEVIVPANTYIASILAITENGLVPGTGRARPENLSDRRLADRAGRHSPYPGYSDSPPLRAVRLHGQNRPTVPEIRTETGRRQCTGARLPLSWPADRIARRRCGPQLLSRQKPRRAGRCGRRNDRRRETGRYGARAGQLRFSEKVRFPVYRS